MTMSVVVNKITIVDGPYGHQALIDYQLLIDERGSSTLTITCSMALPEEKNKGGKKKNLLAEFLNKVEKKLAIVHGILSEEKCSPALLANQKRG